MAALAPLGGGTPTTNTEANFTRKVTGRQLPTPRIKRAKKASDVEDVFAKLMFFGGWGTGKTTFLRGPLLAGLKGVVISTDTGGDGLNSVRLWARQTGRLDLLDNLIVIELRGDDEVQEFLDDPRAFYPEIYDDKIDFLMWDGFSGWQQVDVSEKVGEIIQANAAAKEGKSREMSEARTSGYQMEQSDWGIIRNMTVRGLDKFCGLKNEKTGKVWHKFLTCQEGTKLQKKGDKSELVESRTPLLQGAGGTLSGGAFDLIIRCDDVRDENGKKAFVYYIDEQSNMVKNRGFEIPAQMPAEPLVLWNDICKQLGISSEKAAVCVDKPTSV